MIIAVPTETFPGESRVALTPGAIPKLVREGADVVIEAGAGSRAGFEDAAYKEKGASVEADRAELFRTADVVLQVRAAGANPISGAEDIAAMKSGQIVIGQTDPFTEPSIAQTVAATGANLLSLELIPRITRAQSMDVLSSMATLAGYKAVLLAAANLPRIFPMMMTAAGTIAPAKVFIVGVGVAGLMAIAQARKLGAIVEAYDVRPAVKEQVESLGAKFVEMELDADDSEGEGGYAKAMDDAFYEKQRELMTRVVAANDVVITTAAIPGKKAPVLVTDAMVQGMKHGSVIVDLAAVTGGNCELTRPDETVREHGVTILGPTNLPSELAHDASNMFSNNITSLLTSMLKDGQAVIDTQDEVIAGTLVTHNGKVVHPAVLERLDNNR